jgi:hypothetical protein
MILLVDEYIGTIRANLIVTFPLAGARPRAPLLLRRELFKIAFTIACYLAGFGDVEQFCVAAILQLGSYTIKTQMITGTTSRMAENETIERPIVRKL